MDIFLETTFRPCALKFFNTLEIDQGNLVHTPIGTCVPQKKF